MTITALAKELNTTPNTIYRRLRRERLNIKDLRDGDATGELSQYGIGVISAMYDMSHSTGTSSSRNGNTSSSGHVTQQDVPESIAVLTAKLEAAEERCRMLEAERDRLLSMLEAATKALEREQADRADERQKLLTGPREGHRRLFGWLKKA